MRDYRTHLQTVAQREPATINAALATVGNFHARAGPGVPNVAGVDLRQRARRMPAIPSAGCVHSRRWQPTRDQATAMLSL